jgi:DNA-binding NtrC family response regulator
MAPGRAKATELAKLLSLAAQPVYLLDEQRSLVFCNQACLDWVGISAEDLLGQRCAYHSEAEPSRVKVAATDLCPPPQALAGQEITAVITRADERGGVSRRSARFLPLTDPANQVIAILVVVEPENLPTTIEPAPPADRSESAWLHERLWAFHRQAAVRLHADRLVGESPAMRRVRAQVATAAETQASVLLLGPPGSGRQRIAAAIHYSGPSTSPGSLIPLACNLLDPELILSTIRALANKPSGSERPERETLLLNDVDGLALAAQRPLVELLSAKSWPLRLIATSRQSIEDLARQDKYRADLAMLLSTIVIQAPPLAERREDLPLLAQQFLEQCNARSAKQLAGFSPEALDHLAAYPWPGNADELAQMVTEAHGRAEGAEIGPSDLPPRLHLAAAAAAHPRRVEPTIELDEFLARIERELLRRAMTRAKGNKSKAAKLLGMTRPRLYRRLMQQRLEDL